MATIAVTGISGCLGRNLLAQLEVDPEVDLVLGLDVAAPPPGARKLVFARRCVGEPFAELSCGRFEEFHAPVAEDG